MIRNNGYCILKAFVSEDDLLEVMQHNNTDDKWVGELFQLNNIFGKILTQPALSEINYGYLGQNHLTTYCIHNLHPANSGKDDYSVSDWHVDYPVHDYDEPYPEEIISIEGIIALDDFTIQNGATQVMSGSHKSRSYPTNVSKSGYTSKRITMRKGDLLLFDSKLWHRARKNSSHDCRSCLVFNFSRMDVEPKDNIKISKGCGFKKLNNRIILR
jgi:ectoine hydroxylase-related dioxygenase (phytanoyl-CoA dioxygenase family)